MSRLRYGWLIVAATAGILLAACESVPDPVLPPREKAASRSEAQAQYEQYRLSKVGHIFWGAYYLQGMKPYRYRYQRLSHLYTESSQEARSAYRKGSNLAVVGSVFAGVGGGLIGYPLGWYLSTNELDTREYVMVGAGVVSTGISVLLSILANNALEEATVEYNLDLRQTLGAE
jgi:hypothetical protein